VELIYLKPRAKRRAQSPFDHRVHSFHLPALAVLALEPTEPRSHQTPPSPCRRFVRRPAPPWRNDCPDTLRADGDMDTLGVEIGICQQRVDLDSAHRLAQHLVKLHQIGGRSTPRYCREDHVTLAVDREDNLRKVRVGPVAARIPVCLALGEIATDVARFQAGPVHGN
jgi:hypothetical protein